MYGRYVSYGATGFSQHISNATAVSQALVECGDDTHDQVVACPLLFLRRRSLYRYRQYNTTIDKLYDC